MALSSTIASGRFLTFRVDAQLYALPADEVVEVMLLPQLALVPQAPPALLGVANLRGAVLPVASLHELLGKAAAQATPDSRAIVLDIGAPVAVVVDAVETLETASAEQVDARKNEVNANEGEKLRGAFAVGDEKNVARILDIKALLDAAFARRAQAKRHAQAGAAPVPQRAEEEAAEDTAVYVSFEVAGQEFALALDTVREVIALPPAVTAVARSEAAVVGVISVRETLLPLLSLRTLLGFGAATSQERAQIVVAQVAGTQVGLVADRARSIVAANLEHIDPVPAVLAARAGGEARIKAIYRGDGGRRLVSILSPEQLFREDVMHRLAANHQRNADAAPAAAETRAELIFLVFCLGADQFGLPIDTVVEVAQVPEQITRVPKTPNFLEGVINLRGEVLPVIDQRRRFDMPKLDAGARRRLVVIQTGQHRAGLIVDGVADVLRVAPDAIEPAPELTDAITRLVSGVINLEDPQRLVLALDPAEVLTRAERGMLDSFQAKTAG